MRNRKLDCRNWNLETSDTWKLKYYTEPQKLKIKNWKLEIKNRKLENRNRKLETGQWKLRTVRYRRLKYQTGTLKLEFWIHNKTKKWQKLEI